ncbi:gluconate 2-dehydrogenase subunit 3 family protein [Streptomyces sp. AgN23]|uniref:gluconate 2-dehydrogenase subunit 3 family protein n=1 Tax=Streptomyces sp. AgN23 TaxID=1188315 RepID=UPI001B320D19|nr:gluconate 2-dehydrogenase subunit 3 family protein [Streptomyces sp. AgN23]QTI87269.1 gluconate 2-dehydrogenase subunit 3 family protein [Streptomyces sp. AgN23]
MNESTAEPTGTSLGDEEVRTLLALVDRLIPADGLGPGAIGARVDRYILRALAGPLTALAPVYETGLRAVAAHARDRFGAGPDTLPPADRDRLVADLESGSVPGADDFFDVLLGHTLEGFLGDPAHGGNHDFAGWRAVGYPGPRLVVGEPEQRPGFRPPPAGHSTFDLEPFRGGRP